MKTIKVAVNKTPEHPEGVEIQVADPENDLEKGVLAYLLAGFVRDAKARGMFKADLPERFNIRYEREGSFVLATEPSGPSLSGNVHTYYTPARPLAVLAVHVAGNRLDVVYGEVGRKSATSEAPQADAAADPQPTADSESQA